MGASATVDNSELSVAEAFGVLLERDPGQQDRAGLRELSAAEQRVRGYLDACRVRIARRGRELAIAERPSAAESPSATIGALLDAGCRSGKDAKATATHEAVCAELPEFEAALENGDVSAAHLDTLGRLMKNLTDEERSDVRAQGGELLQHATREFAETFDKTARALIERVRNQHRPDAAQAELDAQRHASNVTSWVDKPTGMHKTLIELDPLRAAALKTAVDAHLARLKAQPGGDKLTYQQLKVDALLAALTAPGPNSAARRVPELIVLIDWETLKSGVVAAGGICELSDGTPLPVATVRQMACEADIIPVVLGGHGEVLDVGRARRLATPAQRVALTAMYSTCPEPGCDHPIDGCHAHHTKEWNAHHGQTNLNDLLPVCPGTHTRIHEQGWAVEIIGNHDRMIWTRPDGTITYDGPAKNRQPQPPTPDDHEPPPEHHQPRLC